MSLRDQIIRLAYEKPELRAKLRPLLKEAWGYNKEVDISSVQRWTDQAGGKLTEPLKNLRIWAWGEEDRGVYYLAWASNKRARRVKGFKSYRSEAERNKAYKTLILNVKKRLDEKKRERDERAAFQHSLKVGDILSGSWGYDQTNVTFAQVTKLVGSKMVEVRRINSKVVGDKGQELLVVPAKDSWWDNKVYKKKVDQRNGVSLNSSIYLSPWDGKPERKTHPMYGH